MSPALLAAKQKLTTRTLADELGVSTQTVRSLVAEGRIDHIKVGGRRGFVFPDCAIDQARRELDKRFSDSVVKGRKTRLKRQLLAIVPIS